MITISNNRIGAACRQVGVSIKTNKLSLDGDLYEPYNVGPADSVIFRWDADGKWYQVAHDWDKRREIPAPAPARLALWQRQGNHNLPTFINFAGIPTRDPR